MEACQLNTGAKCGCLLLGGLCLILQPQQPVGRAGSQSGSLIVAASNQLNGSEDTAQLLLPSIKEKALAVTSYTGNGIAILTTAAVLLWTPDSDSWSQHAIPPDRFQGIIGVPEGKVLIWNSVGNHVLAITGEGLGQEYQGLSGVFVERIAYLDGELVAWGFTSDDPERAMELVLSDHGMPVGRRFVGVVLHGGSSAGSLQWEQVASYPGASVKAVAMIRSGLLLAVLASGETRLVDLVEKRPTGQRDNFLSTLEDLHTPAELDSKYEIWVALADDDRVFVSGVTDNAQYRVYSTTPAGDVWQIEEGFSVSSKTTLLPIGRRVGRHGVFATCIGEGISLYRSGSWNHIEGSAIRAACAVALASDRLCVVTNNGGLIFIE